MSINNIEIDPGGPDSPRVIYCYTDTPESRRKVKEVFGMILDEVLKLRINKKYDKNEQISSYVFKSFYCKAGRRAND